MVRWRDLKYDDIVLMKEVYDRFGTGTFMACDLTEVKVNNTGQQLSRICNTGFMEKERERYTNRYRHIYRINTEGVRVVEALGKEIEVISCESS